MSIENKIPITIYGTNGEKTALDRYRQIDNLRQLTESRGTEFLPIFDGISSAFYQLHLCALKLLSTIAVNQNDIVQSRRDSKEALRIVKTLSDSLTKR